MNIFATFNFHQKKLIELLALPLPHSKASLTVARQRGHLCSLMKNKVGESLERKKQRCQNQLSLLEKWEKMWEPLHPGMEALTAEQVVASQLAWRAKGILEAINWSTDHTNCKGRQRNPGRKKTSSVTWQTGQVPAATASSREAAVPHSSPLTSTQWSPIIIGIIVPPHMASMSACLNYSPSPKHLWVLSKSSSLLPFWQTGKRRRS